MFGSLKNKDIEILAAMDGEIKSVENAPDEVFSQKMMGDGIVIFPTSGKVYAPVTGKIIQVAHTFHAIIIETKSKDVILTHVGLDTVELNGEGFDCKVKTGDSVKAGDLLMEVDFELLKEKNCNLASPCILLTDDKVDVNILEKDAKGGKTKIATIKK